MDPLPSLGRMSGPSSARLDHLSAAVALSAALPHGEAQPADVAHSSLRRPHLLAVADTDSYLKWSVATLAALPAGWRVEQVLVTNPVAPSASQVAAVVEPGVPTLSLPRLLAHIRHRRPEVVLLACTGPVVEVLTALPGIGRGRHRPVLVTGLPGIAAANVRAVRHRARCDLLVAHSHAEVEELALLAAREAPGLGVGLARLPFLTGAGPPAQLPAATSAQPPAATSAPPVGNLVFAAQAKVPVTRPDRETVLRRLALVQPAGSVVVKLRASDGDRQTHHETWPYPLLWQELVRRGEVEPDRVRFATGSMAAALDGARALVTVSSTAALEAMARGLPVAVLSDFGVSASLVNSVYAESGCLATLDDVGAGRIRRADPEWLLRHYLHPVTDCDWQERLRTLVRRRRMGGLPDRPGVRGTRPTTRARWWLRILAPGLPGRRPA